MSLSYQSYMSVIEDPRESYKVFYPLDEVLLLALCGVLSGCDNIVSIAEYGEAKLDFLRGYLPFKHGTPSHDVLSSIFRRLDPQSFEEAFHSWALGVNEKLKGVVAIDGKTLRGSSIKDRGALHMISAWASEARVVIGQRASQSKKNEIKDIPVLLDLLSYTWLHCND